MKGVKRSFVLMVLMIVMIAAMYAGGVYAKESGMLQFTAGGHVLGFEKTGMYAASGSYALRIGFAGTQGVMPETRTGSLDTGKAIPLQDVRYPGLWKGITLTYTCTDGGILESTYYAEPYADVKEIRLVYNVPVETAENGALNLKFETGHMTESPPEAWQEINGQKVPVPVSFRKIAEYEAGFETGPYNTAFPLIIDPVLAWNTFMGSSSNNERGRAIAVDGSGNVYVAGHSWATWSSPV